MKKFSQFSEAKASIWDNKPKSVKDAEDPEVYIHGWGRLQFSQMKQRLVRASEDFLKWAKGGEVEYIMNKMELYHAMLEGIQDIEKEMKKPAWKSKITKLKSQGK